MTLLWDGASTPDRYRMSLGTDVQVHPTAALIRRAVEEVGASAQVVIGPEVDFDEACALVESTRAHLPEVGFVLLRHRLDVTTLSQALRSGFREVVPADDGTAIADAVRRSRELTARLVGHGGASANRREGHVVTVFSAKGGVGKTTLSTNLACHLAASGHSTVLVDLDLSFGDVAISLHLLPDRSVHDAVAMTGHLDEQGLASIVTRHESSGLDVICAPSDPALADRIPASTVVELLQVCAASYEFVVVDTPPSFTEHVLAACDASALMVLIATLDIPAVKNLRIALDTLDQLGTPKDARVVVLNRADAKVGLRSEEVVTALRAPIAASVPASSDVPAATSRGVPIVLDEPQNPVSVALRELGDVHIRQRFGHEVAAERRRRLFRSRR